MNRIFIISALWMYTILCIIQYKSLVHPTSLSVVFSVQGTSGSLRGPDPEKRVGDQDNGNPGRPVSSGLQVPGEPFRTKNLSAPLCSFKLITMTIRGYCNKDVVN
jgi:hypothetical protein